jgi:hypothetical protein
MTTLHGALGQLNNEIGNYKLPIQSKRYVVYEIGQSSASVLGIDSVLLNWIRLDDLVKLNEMVIFVHIKQRMLPLSAIYVYKNENNNLIFAVDVKSCSVLLNTKEDLYIHVFSNDYLAGDGATIQDPVVDVGSWVDLPQTAANILTAYYAMSGGNKLLFHNGFLVNDTTVSEVAVGDTLTAHHDKTGRGYFDVIVNDLKHFTSELDMRGKLIIQVPDYLSDSSLSIEPGDEVEIFVCAEMPTMAGARRIKGIYYSRLHDTDMRMLTHRDFAIDAGRVEALMDEHSGALPDNSVFFLRVFLRHHTNGLITTKDNVFLHDLFRLDMADRLHLMTDSSSVNPAWKVENLEKSELSLLRSTDTNLFNINALKDIYSWPELNHRARSGEIRENVYILPEMMHVGGIALCFDIDGKLQTKVSIAIGSGGDTIAVPVGVSRIECIPGSFVPDGGAFDRDTDFNSQDSYYAEKYYWSDVNSTNWVEAVEGVDYVIDADTGALRWEDIHNEHARMKRSIYDSVYRHYEIEPEEFYHPLRIYRDDGPVSMLPLARLDVFVNGNKCIEGIDYEVNYPMIQMTNKQYYIESDNDILVDIFHYGVPNYPNKPSVYSFVKNRLSRDTDVDVFFEHRNMSLFIDGRIADIGDVNLYESPEIATKSEIREGALCGFEVWPHVLGPWAMKRLFGGAIDSEFVASATVSNFIAQPTEPAQTFIPYGHAIFSPFLKRMLVRLRDGTIDVNLLGLSETGVALTVSPYMSELNNDIAKRLVDCQMVDIHPTSNIVQVDVSEEELLFLRMISKIYFKSRIVFNAYTNIQEDIAPHT